MNINNTRNKEIDIVKGLAIFLVIFGHSIQYLGGDKYLNSEAFFDNVLFKLIYSFHMPLFMMLSGFLFAYSINKYTIRELISKRFKSLIVPILTCSVLERVILYILGNNLTVKMLVATFITSLWFLWAVFFCSLAVIIVNKYFKDNLFVYLTILIILAIFPDKFNKDLYAFMYPYFIFGYFANIKNWKEKLKNNALTFLLVIAYLILMIFFNKSSYIYTTGITIFKSNNISFTILNDLYRYIVGFIGSLLMISLVSMCKANKNNFITKIGQDTLGLYIINIYLSKYLLYKLDMFIFSNELIYNIFCFIISCGITIVSYYAIKVIKKNKHLKSLLLGV